MTPQRGLRSEQVDRRPDGLWDGCHDDPISPGDAHAVAAGWHDTTQLCNALDAAGFEIERLREALVDLLDVAERSRGGDPNLDSEVWYAARDFARVTLKRGAS